MEELSGIIREILEGQVYRLIISKPGTKAEEYRKIVVDLKQNYYQAAKYTEKQVFHENIPCEKIADRLTELVKGHYYRMNAMSEDFEYMVMISGKGSPVLKKNRLNKHAAAEDNAFLAHNRKKNYILNEGTVIEPLVDMGIFTKEGKVVNSMYDKFKQINRFIEIIDDSVKKLKTESLNIIDFGCGKSYLTFIVYYYLTEIRRMKVSMVGLDLKEEVIRKCNAAAKKYGYQGLRFEKGDINGYQAPFDVDMVISLHACDTATDFAIYNAVQWRAKMIFSVPCCQHELNRQMKPENLSILSEYGIIKERFAALATDAVRGELLEYCGYKTNLLEFVDFEHTPKNILIRAEYRPMIPASVKKKALEKVERLCGEFGFEPTLYKLLLEKNTVQESVN